MGTYDTAQVCLNGHSVNANYKSFPAHNAKFCGKCGAQTITTCPKCNSEIRGEYHVPGFGGTSDYAPHAFCHQCGTPYPWTEKRLSAARELMSELDKLDSKERDMLSTSLDDLIRDTPNTPVATTRFKKLMAKAGSVAVDGFRSILVDIVSEAVKKQLWP